MPQPTLADIPRLVEDTRQAGAQISLDMRVDHADAVPGALARDAYRIVQEALTNIGKHASGSEAHVRVTGAPGHGLHINVRNTQPDARPVRAGPARVRRRPSRPPRTRRPRRRHPRARSRRIGRLRGAG